jgi:RNA polymerase sigma factor (sigma-70 family)
MFPSDEELIHRCREGDMKAWAQVLGKYERLVFSIPLNYGLTRQDAADISQMTFIALVDNLDRLRSDSRLGAWLATVARRHSFHLLYKQKREQPGVERDIGESPLLLNLSEPETAGHWERVDWLNQGLSRLDNRCRELLLALYFGPAEPSYEETARRLGLSVGSIGPLRGRCLGRLRRILEEGE